MAILRPTKSRAGYRVRWKEHGIPRQRTCRTLEEARLVSAEKTLARRRVSPLVKWPNVRLGDYADRWLNEIEVAPKTRASYAENLSGYIKPALGQFRVRD